MKISLNVNNIKKEIKNSQSKKVINNIQLIVIKTLILQNMFHQIKMKKLI
jgi:hypothetical protein